jgi:photosystem II stability/assembly factor-like uncharacterized protein
MRIVQISEKAALMLSAAFLLTGASMELRAQGEDPDIPRFMANRTQKEEFMRMRDQYIATLRGFPHSLPYDPRAKAIVEMQQHVSRTLAKVSSTAWTPLGPAPIPNGQTESVTTAVSGRVSAVEIHPSNPNIVYVGTAQGGVYRTVDGGAHWTPIFDAAQSLAIGSLALAPSNPTILYVGTGEANFSADSYAGVGLYRIDNADTSPILVGPINPAYSGVPGSTPFGGRAISKILVHPTDPATIFVATASGIIGIGADPPLGNTLPPLGPKGIWRSTNATAAAGSVAFTKLTVTTAASASDNTGNRSITDMVFCPGSADTIICAVLGLSTGTDGGIYRTTNALAATPVFTKTFTLGTATATQRAAFGIYRRGGVTVVYTATGEPSSGTGCLDANQSGALRVSTDGGVNWSGKLAGGGGFCGGQCFYNVSIAVVPGIATANDTIHIGGNVSSGSCQRLHALSVNGGATFTNFDSGLHADTHAITVAPSNSRIVYHGNDGGIFKSTDGGHTWTSQNVAGFNATQFQSIALHPTDANFSIGGTQDNGTNMYTPLQNWNRIDFGDGGYAEIDQNATDVTNVTMYHTYFNQTNNLLGFARVTSVSTASDGLWTFLGCNGAPGNGITCTDAVLFYAPMALGPGNPNTVYYGSDRLYRSTNTGTNNTAVSQAPLVAGVPISTIAVSPQDDSYRIVGLTNGALFYTTTGSSVMSVLDPTGGGSVVPDRYVGRVAFDPSNKNTAYITLGWFMGGTGAAQSHVWKVTNLGTTPVLTAINSGLPDVPVNAFVVDPASSNNLFAGTDIGVYNSTDGGTSWNVFGTGLPVVAVFDMAIQKNTRTLRVATHGRGMWENSGPPLPIQLASLTGTAISGQAVRIQWSTLSETDSYGFEVQKSATQTEAYQSISGSFVQGHGTTTVPQHYSYTDNSPGNGTVYYRLKQLDLDGTLRYSDGIAVDVASGLAGNEFPTEFSLSQSYPNPFNPSTNIRYGLPRKAFVTLEVFSTLGQRVATLIDKEQEAGYHDVTFNASGLASGAYFYTVTAGDYHASRKLVLLK